ncbi:MAG TPA: SRPBCC family protein [Gaiellaceae bacterium]|nr:SRPBCC family protein [Gaiellaceae bacterium]
MEHVHTQPVAAPPDRVFAALADIENLPRYVPRLEVSPDGDGCRLTLFLATARGDAPDSEVMGTLDAIRRLVEAEE